MVFLAAVDVEDMASVMPRQAILWTSLKLHGAYARLALYHQTSEASVTEGTMTFVYISGLSHDVLSNIVPQGQKNLVALFVTCSRCDLYINFARKVTRRYLSSTDISILEPKIVVHRSLDSYFLQVNGIYVILSTKK